MKFQYYENDAMDTVPAPPLKMVLSLLGCAAIFVAVIVICGQVLGG